MLDKGSICKYKIIRIDLYMVSCTTNKDSSFYCTFKKRLGKGKYFLASVGRKCIAYLQILITTVKIK